MEDNRTNYKTLLIADKDDDLSSSLALFFSDNFNVKVIKNHSAIRDYLASAHYLLIDADIVNDADIDFLHSIKKSFPCVMIILMYKASSKKYPEHYMYQQYSDAILFKPFDAEDIFRIISHLKREKSGKHS